MANVTGQIGNDYVNLENAATEATLQLLLKATLATSKAQKEAISQLAEKAGLDNEQIESANKGTNLLGKTAYGAGVALGVVTSITTALGNGFQRVIGFAEALANNEGKASNVFAAFGDLPFGIGAVMQGFSALQKIQEDQLVAYQKMTVTGANLGGSLDQVRMTAARLNLTMDQFADLVSRSGEQLVTFGGNTETGLKAFIRIGTELNSGEIGRGLRGLGYTSEQINEHLMKYVAMSGGRSNEELRNTRKITQETQTYLKELDRLAQLTGQSREELEKKMEQEAMEASWQLWLSQQDTATREAAMASLQKATALYGKAGADLVKAQAMGVAVQGEAGAQLAALSGETARLIGQDYEMRRRGAGDEALRENERRMRQATVRDLNGLSSAVLTFTGAADKNNEAMLLAARENARSQGDIQRMREIDAQLESNQAERGRSQAAAQADKQVAMIQLGAQVMEQLLKLSQALDPLMNKFLQALPGVITWLANTLPGALTTLKDWLEKAWPSIEKLGEAAKEAAMFLSPLGTGLKTAFSWLLDNPTIFATLGIGVLGAIAAFKVMQGVQAVKGAFGMGGASAAANAGSAGAGAASGGFLKGLGAQFNAAAGWLFKGLAIGASMIAIGYGLTKLAEGLQSFSGGKVDWDGMSKAGVTIGVLTAAMLGLGRLLSGPQLAYFALGAVAIAGVGLALRAFPADVLESMGVLFDKVGHTIGDMFVQALDAAGRFLRSIGDTAVAVFNGVADGVGKLAAIGGAGLIATAGGITALGGALGVFGVGGALASIVSGLGGFDSLARGLSALAAVDPSNLGNVGKGLRDFSDNLPGFWQSIGDATKLSQLGESLEPIAVNLERLSLINPAMLMLLSRFISTVVAARLGKDGIIIFTDHTVELLRRFSVLPLKANVDQINRLKDIAINEFPTATDKINDFTVKLNALLSADINKIKKLSEAIKELKTSMTLESGEDTSMIEYVIQKLLPSQSGGSTGTPGSKEAAEEGPFEVGEDITGSNTNQLLENGFEALNNNITRLLNISSQISENTYRTATRISGGNMFNNTP